MNQIPQDIINEIINSTDIVDVISDYVSLTPRGKNFFGVCPFHDDSNPSMSVSKDKQIYKCFPCGAKGGVVTFIMDYENISYIETIKKLADRANIPLDIKPSHASIINEKFKNLYDVCENTTKFYFNILKSQEGREAREYLKSRNITDDVIETFRIGLSLSDRSMLTKFLTKLDFEKKDILKTGLIINNDNGTYDSYKNRIMFPLEDIQGKIVGFSGRIYNTEDNSKYINSPETEIFKKGETLYNYKRAKDVARISGQVIIVEGFMDVIRAHSVGFTNVIATMGTAITEKQASVIAKMAKEVILCFDGDKAGLKATNSCIKELKRFNISPKVIRLEDNMDPDEFIQKFGKDAFLERINKAMSVLEYKIKSLKGEFDLSDIQDKALYTKEAIELLNEFEDEFLREIAFQEILKDSGLTEEFLRSKLKKIVTLDEKIDNLVMTEPQKKQTGLNKYDKAQVNLIYYMLSNVEAIAVFNKRVTHMPNKNYRLLAREISGFYQKHRKISIQTFLNYVCFSDSLKETLDFVLSQNLRDEMDINEIIDYSNVINEYNINEKIKSYQKKLNDEKDLEKQKEIITLITELIKKRSEY